MHLPWRNIYCNTEPKSIYTKDKCGEIAYWYIYFWIDMIFDMLDVLNKFWNRFNHHSRSRRSGTSRNTHQWNRYETQTSATIKLWWRLTDVPQLDDCRRCDNDLHVVLEKRRGISSLCGGARAILLTRLKRGRTFKFVRGSAQFCSPT